MKQIFEDCKRVEIEDNGDKAFKTINIIRKNGLSVKIDISYARLKGEWINHRNDYGHNIADCSLCGKAMQWHDEDEDGIPRYCWYCGASMKGVQNERHNI